MKKITQLATLLLLVFTLASCNVMDKNIKHPQHIGFDFPPYQEIGPITFGDVQNDRLESIDMATLESNFYNIDQDEAYELPTLIVLISFDNVTITSSPEVWYEKYYGDNGVKAFYEEMSGGMLEIIPAIETYGDLTDGVVQITVEEDHPSDQIDEDDYDIDGLIHTYLQEIDPYIDYAMYDIDNNNFLSSTELNIQFIQAGFESNFPGTRTDNITHPFFILTSDEFLLDGIYLDSFTFLAEKVQDGFGTAHLETVNVICHEIGHTLGLPDLYDTDYSSLGTGAHGLMSGGVIYTVRDGINFQPTEFSPWSKISLGFETPKMATESGTYELFPSSNEAYFILKVPTNNPDQYYLLEYRIFEGYNRILKEVSSDIGVAIWYVDEDRLKQYHYHSFIIYGDPNNDELSQGIKLIESNAFDLGYSQLDNNVEPTRFRKYTHYFSEETYNHYFDYNRQIGLYFGEANDSILVKVVFDDTFEEE